MHKQLNAHNHKRQHALLLAIPLYELIYILQSSFGVINKAQLEDDQQKKVFP